MPLFFDVLSVTDKVKLIMYQWETHGEKLVIPQESPQQSYEIPVHTEMNREELSRFMRQRPHSPRQND